MLKLELSGSTDFDPTDAQSSSSPRIFLCLTISTNFSRATINCQQIGNRWATNICQRAVVSMEFPAAAFLSRARRQPTTDETVADLGFSLLAPISSSISGKT